MRTYPGGGYTGAPTKHWDSIARRYVEHDTAPMETFGELPSAFEGVPRYGANGGLVGLKGATGRSGQPGHYDTGVLAGGYVRTTSSALPGTEVANRSTGGFAPHNDNVPAARRGDWMQTYLGGVFYPLDPRQEEVDIEDIAHALSMQCRFGGHSLRFYSVAEHSVHIARWIRRIGYGPEAVLWGLLHDAAEAYVADVPRPLKRHLVGYAEHEARVMDAICDRFGLAHGIPFIAHEVDGRILADEIRQNMKPMDWHARHENPLGVTLEFWSPGEAKAAFLAEFVAAKGRAVA